MINESLLRKIRKSNLKFKLFYSSNDQHLPEEVFDHLTGNTLETIIFEFPARENAFKKKLLLLYSLFRNNGYQFYLSEHIMLLSGPQIYRVYFRECTNGMPGELIQLLISFSPKFIELCPLLNFEEYSYLYKFKDRKKVMDEFSDLYKWGI